MSHTLDCIITPNFTGKKGKGNKYSCFFSTVIVEANKGPKKKVGIERCKIGQVLVDQMTEGKSEHVCFLVLMGQWS